MKIWLKCHPTFSRNTPKFDHTLGPVLMNTAINCKLKFKFATHCAPGKVLLLFVHSYALRIVRFSLLTVDGHLCVAEQNLKTSW